MNGLELPRGQFKESGIVAFPQGRDVDLCATTGLEDRRNNDCRDGR